MAEVIRQTKQGDDVMKYRIESNVSGLVLGVYEGSSKEEARDAYARDAGYDDYADLCSQIPNADPNNLLITEVDEEEEALKDEEDIDEEE